ncbi:ATP-dependent Clp protease adaptor ClpS [Desulfobacterota bacterium AH_259_B03_O07]|nr:ATP-dependent Clp protease adaptor ClpS [Desulfobacterota bacterium AH_259_B03_O07]
MSNTVGIMVQNQFCLNYVVFDFETRDVPKIRLEDITELEESQNVGPQYNVVLLDDNVHTYDYVIEMLMDLFQYSKDKAFEKALTVDIIGRVVVYSSSKENALRKKDQIISYGPDWRMPRSNGSMSAIIEPVE